MNTHLAPTATEDYTTFSTECANLWRVYRERTALNGSAYRWQTASAMRAQMTALLNQAVNYLRDKQDNSGHIEVAIQFYQVLLNLLELRVESDIAELGIRVAKSLRDSEFLRAGWTLERGKNFAEVMRNMAHLFRLMADRHEFFFGNLEERIGELSQHLFSDWNDKFNVQKTLLIMLLICWNEDARTLALTTSLKEARLSSLLVTQAVPISCRNGAEIQIIVFIEGRHSTSVKLTVRLPDDIKEAILPDREDDSATEWGFAVRPNSPRSGVYDFRFKVKQSSRAGLSSSLKSVVQTRIYVDGNEGAAIELPDLPIEFFPDEVPSGLLVADNPVATWFIERRDMILESPGTRFVLSAKEYRIADQHIDCDSLSTIFRNSVLIPLPSVDDFLRGLDPRKDCIWIVEVSGYEEALRFEQELRREHPYANAIVWIALFPDLMNRVFPKLFFQEPALARLEALLLPITEERDHRQFYELLYARISDGKSWRCDVDAIEDIYKEQALNIGYYLESSLRSFDDLALVESVLGLLAQAVAEKMLNQGLDIFRADATRIPCEFGQIFRHAPPELDPPPQEELIYALNLLVDQGWCRLECFQYSFSSSPHFRFAYNRFSVA